MKHEATLYSVQAEGPWIFQDINCDDRAGGYNNVDAAEQAKLEWDSDDDNVLQIGDTGSKLCGHMDLLGFFILTRRWSSSENRRKEHSPTI
jgi:hypothetical protein